MKQEIKQQELMNKLELNKIYCESNLETMKRMPNNFVDYVLTSPPYNVGYNQMNGDDTKNIKIIKII